MARNGVLAGLGVAVGVFGGEDDVDDGLDVWEVRVNDSKDSCSEVMELLEVGYTECDVQFSACLT